MNFCSWYYYWMLETIKFVLIVNFWCWAFVGIIYLWITRRSRKKYNKHLNASEFSIPGTLLNMVDNKINTAVLRFNSDQTISIIEVANKEHASSTKTLSTNDYTKITMPLTASLATSHISIATSNGMYKFYNDVDPNVLMHKFNMIGLGVVLPPIEFADSYIKQRSTDNPYFASDKLVLLHHWLKKYYPKKYKRKIESSDAIGFFIITFLPIIGAIGVALEGLSEILTGTIALGSQGVFAIIAVLVILGNGHRIYSLLIDRKRMKSLLKQYAQQTPVIAPLP